MNAPRFICAQCSDVSDIVTSRNGKTLIARLNTGETIVSLHDRCTEAWAVQNDCRALLPLRMPGQPNRATLRVASRTARA